ncbi:MAG: rRNA pseudouridine synthase [Clostridiales bacterium]|jgi:23S rRNA pseudouridine2605 synthase|nr:rRNA pseudouridine synthase [Clostridiales bacterium]
MTLEESDGGLCRLNKYIASAGFCSRRKAEDFILSGKVAVNGEIVTSLGAKVNVQTDTVTLDGEKITPAKSFVYIMLNKPQGCVTTAEDQFGRKTVMDFLRGVNERVFPVGRLDYNTSGLLLLTNDGEFANKITHPKYKADKTYMAQVRPVPSSAALEKLRRGVLIKEENDFNNTGASGNFFKTAPAKVRVIKGEKNLNGTDNKNSEGTVMLEITIHEGRNRQVRKMCEAVGLEVVTLHRIKVGRLSLGALKPGAYRFLTKDEISEAMRLAQ